MDRLGPPKISRQENENRPPMNINIILTGTQYSQFAGAQPAIEAETVELLDNPDRASTDD